MKKLIALVLALAMCLSLTGCFAVLGALTEDREEEKQTSVEQVEQTEEATEEIEQIEETTETVAEAVVSVALRPEFKEAMDAYEAFMNEYCAFMKKYTANPMDMGLLSDYASYMSKYTDVTNAFAKWESEDMNAAELDYYLEVSLRVSQNLLEAAQ